MVRQKRRLRKQPKLKRIHSSDVLAIPRIVVPDGARKRRRRNRRRLRLPTRALVTLITSARLMSLTLLLVTVWALILIGRDDAFFLSVLPVEGAELIPDSEVITASGLDGQHIFLANPSEVAQRLDQIPGVISATVSLAWPNEILINIAEESPVAIWEQAGRRYWINEEGDLIPARADDRGLLVIQSESLEPISDDFFVPQEALEGALRLRELRPNIDRLHYRPARGISYQDGRGWRAYFGVGLDMERKLAVYEAIVEELLSNSITPEYISVSNQNKPFYRAIDG